MEMETQLTEQFNIQITELLKNEDFKLMFGQLLSNWDLQLREEEIIGQTGYCNEKLYRYIIEKEN